MPKIRCQWCERKVRNAVSHSIEGCQQWEKGWWKADEDSPMKVHIDGWEQKVIMTDRHPAYGTDEDPLGKRYWYDRI